MRLALSLYGSRYNHNGGEGGTLLYAGICKAILFE
nr:MAG TPA: hypothetical protein [Caudoviricetes sp.]